MVKNILMVFSIFGFILGGPLLIVLFIMNSPSYLIKIVQLLVIASGAYFFITIFIPSFHYVGDTSKLHDNARLVKESGDIICSENCDGSLFFTQGRGIIPTHLVVLYPIGIWIKPMGMNPIGLYYNEITSVSANNTSFLSSTRITHNSKLVTNPILLYLPEDNELIRVLKTKV
jgi:hypothetical protein